jgi:hypothetical protein
VGDIGELLKDEIFPGVISPGSRVRALEANSIATFHLGSPCGLVNSRRRDEALAPKKRIDEIPAGVIPFESAKAMEFASNVRWAPPEG